MTARCVLLLGGSFDPVHAGHLALAHYFTTLLAPDELRIIPAGSPWQKGALEAGPEDRLAMLALAFGQQTVNTVIDRQEIDRHTATFTIDTLRALRAELGERDALVLVIGADQLQHLDTWRDWRQLFDHAHLCAAARPGFGMKAGDIAPAVMHEIAHRSGTASQMRETPSGLALLAPNLAINVSSTELRAQLRRGGRPDTQVPAAVLDYIQQHHLYKSKS